MFETQLVLNGVGGDALDLLLNNGLDTGILRPVRGQDGRSYVTLNRFNPKTGKNEPTVCVTNSPSTLGYDEWKLMDDVMVEEALPRLVVWGRLASAGLQTTIPNAFAKTIIQHQLTGKVGRAVISMDAVRESGRARPTSELGYLPLPLIHEDFSFGARELAAAAGGIMPLDATMYRYAVRNVAETMEDLLLGTAGSYEYGGAYVYGLTNFPDRITASMTLPTAPGWTPELFMDEIRGLLELTRGAYYFGPVGLLISTAWTKYLDGDYSAAYNGDTLRSRLMKVGQISWMQEVDRLIGFKVIVVPLSKTHVELIDGMPLQALQWGTMGDLVKAWKVMTIKVPRIRADINGNCPIVDATAS